MIRTTAAALSALAAVLTSPAAMAEEGPERVTRGNLVMENIPEIPDAVRERVLQYQTIRAARFTGFTPEGGIYIATRFGETDQIHAVEAPMGMRRQLTFYEERVGGADVRPDGSGRFMFTRDVGGDEFFQGFVFDPATASAIQFTEDQTRNQGLTWSPDGVEAAWASAGWGDPDYTVRIGAPEDPDTWRAVYEGEGAVSPRDWSPDGERLLIGRYVSINRTDLFVLDPATGEAEPFEADRPAAYGDVKFAPDGESLIAVTDEGSEFRRIVRIGLEDGARETLAEHDWDVAGMAVSPDGETIAYTINAGGVSELYLIDAASGAARPAPDLPMGIVSGLGFSPDGARLGFTHASPSSPGDAWTYDLEAEELTRWTRSEVGGLDTGNFVAPELISYESFDGLEVPAFVYRPEGDGPHPVIVSIHGGPESQARPGFDAHYQYWVNELGVALVVPNVRGSSGYGNEYVNLDNAEKREDSVRDIGALLDWIETQDDLDSDRIVVHGRSYGGYMVLASLVHYSDRLAGGVNIVGISNFVTFLENTAGYRQDLRRAEYGDERDPDMRAFLEEIAPANNAERITAPLFIIQGANDPRVPASEAEQILTAVREAGGDPWYLLALDEGHSFARQSNLDFHRMSESLFLQDVLGLD